MSFKIYEIFSKCLSARFTPLQGYWRNASERIGGLGDVAAMLSKYMERIENQ